MSAAADPLAAVTPRGPVAGGRRRRSRSASRPIGWVWLLQRVGYGLIVLFAVSLLIFIATQALPADPAEAILGRAEPERIESLRQQLGLNRPLVTQYLDWISGIVTGDLGMSLTAQAPVSSMIGPRIENTFILLFLAGIIAIPLSILLGALAAFRRDGVGDRAGLVGAIFLSAVPEFVVGLFLIMLFATTVFQVLPAVALADPATAGFASWKSMILPVSILTLAVVPYLYRLVRSTMIDVLESDYIHVARLKGLSTRRIVFGHALPNALAPVIQGSALVLAWLLGGQIVVEYLFSYPGLGSFLLESIRTRDIPVIQAIALIFAASYVIFNIIADVLTVMTSPRLRTGGRQ